MQSFDELDDDALVDRVRADVVAQRVHFNHAGMSLIPTPALDRMRRHLDREAEIGGYEAAAEAAGELAGLPATLAPLLGPSVAADEVAVTQSATRAWETVLWALAESRGWGPSDRVLIDGFTYATTYTTLQRLQVGRNVAIEVVSSRPDGTVDLDDLAARLGDDVQLVAVTHMPTHLGTRTDASAIGALMADHPAVFALDVSQTLGQMPLDVGAYGCEVAYAPGRKFLRGPRGTGLLYVEADFADQLLPLSPPFGTVGPEAPTTFELPSGARRFDAFEVDHAAHLALAEAARYAIAVGLERIERLVAARSADVADRLAATGGIELLAESEAVGIVSFRHDRLTPEEVRDRFTAGGVNVWVNPAGGAPIDGHNRPVLPAVRVSPHYFTDAADLDALERVLADLAG